MNKEEFINKLYEDSYELLEHSNGYADVFVLDENNKKIGYSCLAYEEEYIPECFIKAVKRLSYDPVELKPVFGVVSYIEDK